MSTANKKAIHVIDNPQKINESSGEWYIIAPEHIDRS